MIVLIRKRHLWELALCCSSLMAFLVVFLTGCFLADEEVQQVFAPAEKGPVTWVLDPGHGGEDGGAVSAGGIQESNLNLEITFRINDLLRFTGQNTVMTRTEDVSIHTEGDSIRARKASDIRQRVKIANQSDNAVLLSIHQNSLPTSPVTHGAQAFWNGQDGGEYLANIVQDTLNKSVNMERAKQPKRIQDTIYLMKHTECPAVLVECGFLSNEEETKKLQDPSYQTILATAITAGCLQTLFGEESE